MTSEQIADFRRRTFSLNVTPQEILRVLEEREKLLKALRPIVERLDGDRESMVPDGGAEMLVAAGAAIADAEARW